MLHLLVPKAQGRVLIPHLGVTWAQGASWSKICFDEARPSLEKRVLNASFASVPRQYTHSGVSKKIIGGERRGSRHAECAICIIFIHIYIKTRKYAQNTPNKPNSYFSDFAPLVATLFWSYPRPAQRRIFFVFGMAHGENFLRCAGQNFLPGGCAPRTPRSLLSCLSACFGMERTQTMRLGPFSPGTDAPRQNTFCSRRPPGPM